MKKISVTIAVLLFANLFYAQIIETEAELKKQTIDSLSGWNNGGIVVVNFSQMHFSDNWAAGGQSSYSTNGLLSLFAKYKTPNSSWDNTLDIGYGILKQDTSITKTDDKIEFASKYGKRASEFWYYAVLLSLKSQMAKGYNYPDVSKNISGFFAPAYILGAIGMDFKPNKSLSLFAAPVTGKITVVLDQYLADLGSFGVKPAVIDTATNAIIKSGDKSRAEIGGYIKIAYSKDIMENISLQTKLDLFSNYLNNPERVDVSWEVLIAMKVNKYISANISTNLVYDYDVIDELQFKEVLGIGFSYKF